MVVPFPDGGGHRRKLPLPCSHAAERAERVRRSKDRTKVADGCEGGPGLEVGVPDAEHLRAPGRGTEAVDEHVEGVGEAAERVRDRRFLPVDEDQPAVPNVGMPVVETQMDE